MGWVSELPSCITVYHLAEQLPYFASADRNLIKQVIIFCANIEEKTWFLVVGPETKEIYTKE